MSNFLLSNVFSSRVHTISYDVNDPLSVFIHTLLRFILTTLSEAQTMQSNNRLINEE
jgi:hypothetical protein